jgi:hypothetical protein
MAYYVINHPGAARQERMALLSATHLWTADFSSEASGEILIWILFVAEAPRLRHSLPHPVLYQKIRRNQEDML